MKSLTRQKSSIKAMIFGGFAVCAAIAIAAQIPVYAANTFPHVYELVSVNNVDGQGVNQDVTLASNPPHSISSDGSKILFETTATNLTDSSSGNNAGYIRDMTSGITERIDKSESGIVADGESDHHVMSETGRYVAFRSNATNLIDGTTYTSHYRVYVKDFQTNQVRVINPIVNSSDPNYASTWPTSISNDGRYIVVRTKAINQLMSGVRSTSGNWDAALFDQLKDEWTLLNKPIDGVMQNTISTAFSASCDGSLILLGSYATNLTTDTVGGGYNPQNSFLVDIRNGVKVTYLTPGATHGSNPVAISCNGRYVIYDTPDRTLVTPAPTGVGTSTQVVRYDRYTGERIYVSSKSDGSFSNQGATSMSVTDKGDVVQRVHKYSDGLPHYAIGFKHLSDGSGTLEDVQHIYPGLLYTNGTYAVASSDGKYVVALSRDNSTLGIPVSTKSNGVSVIRIKTGL